MPGQDLNAAQFDLFVRAHDAHRIVIGDEHQSIYSFRGASTAFADMSADRCFPLTRSFRFGPEARAPARRQSDLALHRSAVKQGAIWTVLR